MNMRKTAAAAAVVSTLAVGLPALNWAQPPLQRPVGSAGSAQGGGGGYGGGYGSEPASGEISIDGETVQTGVLLKATRSSDKAADLKMKFMYAGGDRSAPLEMKIREAAGKVGDAKDVVAKEAATTELTSLIDQYFEQDLATRNKELEGIQKRLARLQTQLDRRRAKKQEIIDLQLKVTLNEVDGLGFYSEPGDRMFNFRVPGPIYVPGPYDEMAVPPLPDDIPADDPFAHPHVPGPAAPSSSDPYVPPPPARERPARVQNQD